MAVTPLRCLLPLLPLLACAVASSPSPNIKTPHDAPPLRELIRLDHPPSSGKPACVNEAYFGAYGGVGAEQDHLYYPETLCLQSMAEWYDSLDADPREPGMRTYNPKREGEEAFEYFRVQTTMPGPSMRCFWVGTAGVEPGVLRDDQGVDAPSEPKFRIQGGQLDSVPSINPDGSSTSSRGAHGIAAEADQIRQRLWKIAHDNLPKDLPEPYKSTTSFPSIAVHPISSSSFIIIMPGTPALSGLIDTALPAHLVPVHLPSMSLREQWQMKGKQYVTDFEDELIAEEGKTKVATFAVPVPRERADYLRNITEALTFDAKLDRVIEEGLDVAQLRRDIRWLTGEAPSGWESRHSFTQGARDAAEWIKEQAESTGANCTLQPFLHGFSPNIICKYPSASSSTSSSSDNTGSSTAHKAKEEEHVIFSAHYDSRGSFGLTAAPGGDDDGSGSGHLLAIARAIGKMGIKFDKDVTLAWFAGEEQGLLGSRAYAEKLYQQNATVLLQVQADMLGYHVPGEPLQLGLPETIALPEASALLSSLARMYAPELVVGTTAACCSDHQSFLGLGFPSTQVFERNGWIADPMYHNSGDESAREGYDFEQVRSIGKVTMAALMTVGEWSV